MSGKVRLTGFGIATRAPRERQAPAPPESIAGTPAYMAPQQTGRMNRSIDSRSDLYALGMTFYQVLTGSLPFTVTDPMELIHGHIARDAVAPHERTPAVPAQLSTVVMKLLAVQFAADKKARPADIRATPGVRTRIESHVAPSPMHYRHAETITVSQVLPRPVDLIPASADRIMSFGPFHLLLTQRLLLEGEKPLRLGSRALDILIALVERPGELVSKEELMAQVWPNTFVEPANLTVHVAALRRALKDGHGGNRYLVNIPRRGYCFVAPVKVSEEPKSSAPFTTATERTNNLPASVTRLIARSDTVSGLSARLSGHRLLTIVGPGGIGKTSVALAVAEGLLASYEHGVWFIDLTPLGDPLLVPRALASSLGLDIRSESLVSGLIAALGDKQMLLVLDNCEHVIEAAAALAAELLRSAPGVRILATSREPLWME